jgi:dihydroorotase
MPNTPNPLTGQARFDWHRARIAELNHPVSMLNYVGIDGTTAPIGKPGEHMYKCFFGKSVGTLTVMYAEDLDRILPLYRGHWISFHVEYEPIVLASIAGKTHSNRRPKECVTEGLRLLLPLIEKYGIHAKLCHWSVDAGTFRLIKEYRRRGCDIQLEVSPLHLLFDTSMTDTHPSLWTKVQMNPAIQAPLHREQLIEGLRDGFIDMLATDHAPHTEEEKFIAFAKFKERYPEKSNVEIAGLVEAENPELFRATCCENNTSGAPWLDTYAIVCAWLMREHHFKAQDIARVAAYNPGQFVNRFLGAQFPGRDFGKGFGVIAPEYMGSLTVLNLEKMTTVERKNLKTKVGWSPLEGRTFPGAVEAVFIAGVRCS